MTPAFADKEFAQKYKDILFSWRGTPYRHLHARKRVGADCTLFIGMSLVELGVVKKLNHDYYPVSWHLHTAREYVLNSFAHHIESNINDGFHISFITYDKVIMDNYKDKFDIQFEMYKHWRNYMFGDVPVFSTTATGVSNHCGVWLDRGLDFINSIEKRGCCVLTYGSWWDRRCKGYFRVWRR